jgi:uncharacterized protein DUF1996
MNHRVLVLVPVVALLGLFVPPAQAAQGGQFVLRCGYSHSLPDDPIVFPNQPGASHLHDFYGNTGVNAFSTFPTMLAGETTCRVPSDTAGYWGPASCVSITWPGPQGRPGRSRRDCR